MTTNYRDLFDLSGKHVLVIGAGSGIGRATVHGLADFGATLTCADIDAKAAEAVAGEAAQRGVDARGVRADIADERDVARLIGSLERLDVLVCTPSINVRKPLAKVTAENAQKTTECERKTSQP